MTYPRIPLSDRVRDGVAVVLILVSLVLPWDGHSLAAERIDVVLAAILALFSPAVPYILRSGALSGRADLLRTWLLRASFALPYLAVVVTTLVVDIVVGRVPESLVSIDGLVLGSGTAGGFGAGLGVGLAGVLLAAAPRVAELSRVPRGVDEAWRIAAVAVATLIVLCLLLSTVLGLIDVSSGVPTATMTGLASLLVVMIVFTVPPFAGMVMGDLGWRRVVMWLGATVAAAMLFAPAVESIYRPLSGLVFWPAAAALAAAPGVVRTMNQTAPDALRLGVASRALELIAVTGVAGFTYGVIVFLDVESQRGAQVLSLITTMTLIVWSLTAHAVLRRDPHRGRVTALIAAVVFLMIGLVELVVWVVILDAAPVDPVSLGVSFALPAVVLAALAFPSGLQGRITLRRFDGPPGQPRGFAVPRGTEEATPTTGPIRVFDAASVGAGTAAAARSPESVRADMAGSTGSTTSVTAAEPGRAADAAGGRDAESTGVPPREVVSQHVPAEPRADAEPGATPVVQSLDSVPSRAAAAATKSESTPDTARAATAEAE
ncbi:hypothetical protein FHR81_001454 [Actinoalloteichus hoggarensis]|uniref:DUF7937 domain-containing protein n=1 Tax=Actinoalloteichus hoggarensis TaxID=1470176 RepID=UPI0012FD639A|nr:hypothetical protein [Actinoalloteichus hoggarensis]MBB5920424.1 hypothetical protein [Actinoalloteichus hoggarensis]